MKSVIDKIHQEGGVTAVFACLLGGGGVYPAIAGIDTELKKYWWPA